MGKSAFRALFFIAASGIMLHSRRAEGHGYLASPRSRNLVAFEGTSWVSQTANDPEPETCPQCLNLGGSLGRCGVVNTRSYDLPRNAVGGLMESNVQATYERGAKIVVDVILTAHHKGHFTFSACPIAHGEVPSQACFDEHRLTFVEDMLNGAKLDPNYPERAYLAPFEASEPEGDGVRYSFKMKLPSNLYGDLVLIQWHYLTANSCIHEGYMEYDWPWDYGFNTGSSSSPPCGEVSQDGRGVPEQFWNCAEVKIITGSGRNVDDNKPSDNKKPGKNKPDKNKQPGKEKQPNKNKPPGGKNKPPSKRKPGKKPGRKPGRKPTKKKRPIKKRSSIFT